MSTTINITETAVNVVVTEETINIEASGGQGPVGVGVPAGGTAGQILAKINSTNYNTQWINNTDLVGLTSVGVSMPAAFSVANSPLVANGTIAVTGAGNALQYINGLGNLVTFPSLSGYVTAVTGTSPIASSGGTTPAISIAQATTSVSGFLSSTDWNTFNGKQNALTNPVTGTGTTNTLPKFTGASAIGNSNITDTGSLITLGSNSFLNGSVGIGATFATGITLNLAKTITGGTNATGLLQQGVVLSDVTSIGNGFFNILNTQAASFTLDTYYHYRTTQGTIGAGSSITLQVGFLASSTLTGATTNYGFRGSIPVGTNRWNLYMDGTANNYMAGSLAIGTTSLTGTSLAIGKSITGATSSFAMLQTGTVLSDVTVNGYGFFNQLNTQATSFTLSSYIHYVASQGTIGAGSSVTSQFGFQVESNFIGAANNYAFRGRIPSGTNRWNIYMDGTANNHLGGDTYIGTQTLSTATMLTVGGTETAVSAIARGQLINSTLVASANSDVLVGLDINPTYTIGAFTGVSQYGLRIIPRQSAQIALGGINQAGQITFARGSDGSFQGGIGYTSGTSTGDFSISSGGGAGVIGFQTASTRAAQFFVTGNFTLQNGGTFTDAGFRLDVNGTARVQNKLSVGTPSAASAVMEVTSTTQGFLPPRMTTTEKNAITSPATGLVVFDTTLGKLCVFATTWQTITSV
jgi:hypothetical protein